MFGVLGVRCVLGVRYFPFCRTVLIWCRCLSRVTLSLVYTYLTLLFYLYRLSNGALLRVFLCLFSSLFPVGWSLTPITTIISFWLLGSFLH